MPLLAPSTARFLLAVPALLWLTPLSPSARGQSAPPQPHAASTSPAAGNPAVPLTAKASGKAPGQKTAGASAPSHVLFFYTAERSTVEMEVHTIPSTDQKRLERLRSDFRSAGCSAENMREQPAQDRHGEPGSNLICVWPGDSPNLIVVAAHYEEGGKGQSALVDWSGAALLPFLYQAIQGQSRQNTFVFLESWKAAGAEAWLKSLSRTDRRRIRAMVDVDALGLGTTRYYTTFSPFETPPPGAAHLHSELLWAAIDEGLTSAPEETSPRHWLTVDETGPFRALMVPTIVIHSVAPEAVHIPNSPADLATVVNGNYYFRTYHLMCAFLASLDRVADRLNRDEPFWRAAAVHPTDQDAEPPDETPRVTFREMPGVMKPSGELPPKPH